jgi:hypothetical protein
MHPDIKIIRNTVKQKEPSKLKIIWWKVERKWQALCDVVNPKNKWLTKVIPNYYTENDHLIELVLFKILVNYVEVEKGLTHFEWAVKDGELEYKHLIEDCYRAITVTIPNTQERVDAMLNTDEAVGLYIDADDALTKLKQDTCETIVKIMRVLWT